MKLRSYSSGLQMNNAKPSFKVVTWIHLWSNVGTRGTHRANNLLILKWTLKIKTNELSTISLLSFSDRPTLYDEFFRMKATSVRCPEQLFYHWIWWCWFHIVCNKLNLDLVNSILDEYTEFTFFLFRWNLGCSRAENQKVMGSLTYPRMKILGLMLYTVFHFIPTV